MKPGGNLNFLPQRGEMGPRCSQRDWAATALGPIETWSASLRTATATVLASGYPAALFWGNDCIVIYNDAFIPLIGARHPAALGQPMCNAFPDDSDRFNSALTHVRKGESHTVENERLSLPTGSTEDDAYYTSFYGPVRGERGDVEGALLVIMETTARMREEARNERIGDALRESEERYRVIIENARDYAILTTGAEGTITSWSVGAQTVFGWPPEEAIGQPLAITFVPEDRARGEHEKERATAEAEGFAPDVRWHLRKDGRRVFIEGIARALHDANGNFTGVVKMGQDVTERRKLDTALRESEARFRAVANLVPDLLWQSEPDGSAVWYNDRWFQYTGQSPEHSMGFGWADALHPEDRDELRTGYIAALQAGEPLNLEVRIRNAANSARWFQVRALPLRDSDGNILKWFAAASDIHEHRNAIEQVEQRVRDRTSELARMVEERQVLRQQLVGAEEAERRRLARELHDQLGQHLTGLSLGLAEARRQVSDDGPLQARLAQLQAFAQDMTRDARFIAFELRPPELDDVGFASAIESYVEQWSARFGIAGEVVISGVDANAFPPDVCTALYRIAQESLTNVAKHANARQASVLVDSVEDGSRLIVEDDGRGFHPETREPVARAERRLGIAGMRERAALVGGSITIESAPGKGTTVYAHFPVQPPLGPTVKESVRP